MNEVIGTILEAEARAEEIVRAAEEDAGRILAEGERRAEQADADAERALLIPAAAQSAVQKVFGA